MPYPGFIFQLTLSQNNHFWIVISRELKGKVLAVNITDFKHCPDSPCVINIGDHPVVNKKSVIFYRYAKDFNAAEINKQIAAGTIRKLSDCSPELLSRIIEGAKKADDLTNKFLDYL